MKNSRIYGNKEISTTAEEKFLLEDVTKIVFINKKSIHGWYRFRPQLLVK